MAENPILQSKSLEFQKKVLEAPLVPGCYMYKNDAAEIIYIGKAIKLRNRVKSYFLNFGQLDTAKQQMIDQATDIEMFEVDTEFEALILETNLIKKYHPKYNILMRDDKNYTYVKFERVRRRNMKPPKKFSVYQDFPRITLVRKKKDDGAEYFGPYPDARPVKRMLRKIRKIFPYRTSKAHVYIDYSDGKERIVTTEKKPDLYYHIGLSGGAEFGREQKEEYLTRFNSIRDIFKGKKKSIMNKIERDMKAASDSLDFEKAATLRNKLHDLKYLTTSIRLTNETDDASIDSLKERQRAEMIDQVIKHLNFPAKKLSNHDNFRIECYDISNIQGTNAVGAMTVAIDGQMKPSLYRRFKIKTDNTPDDFRMMQEVLTRRFRQYLFSKQKEQLLPNANDIDLPSTLLERAKNWKSDESFEQRPDLIVIDGGKGQLSSTYKILYQFGLHNDIPIVGLAKREEEVFKMKHQFNDDFIPARDNDDLFDRVLLPRKSEALFLFQRLRDEAHRFGITYHRKLRSKQMLKE